MSTNTQEQISKVRIGDWVIASYMRAKPRLIEVTNVWRDGSFFGQDLRDSNQGSGPYMADWEVQPSELFRQPQRTGWFRVARLKDRDKSPAGKAANYD